MQVLNAQVRGAHSCSNALQPPGFCLLREDPALVLVIPAHTSSSRLPEGSLGAPEVPFYKLPPASHAITSAGKFQAGCFSGTVRRASSWRPLLPRFVWRSFSTFRFAHLSYGPAVKWNNTGRKTHGLLQPPCSGRRNL